MDLAPFCRRARTYGRNAGIAAVALGAVVLTASCGGGGSKAAATTRAPSDSSINLVPGAVRVAAAGGGGAISDEERDAIMATLDGYVNTATMEPLRGKPVGDLTGYFTPEAAAALTGTNRDALVDEGFQPATRTVKGTAQPVPLTALADPAGAINLVGVTLDVTTTTANAAGPVTVHRVGEMVLRRDGNTWKINSYRIVVGRNGAGIQDASPSTSSSSP
jgi:hypothetical protein